jgi:GTP-binding protein
MIIFLVDIRHKPTQNDLHMYNYIMKANLPFMVLANKADKIAPTKVDNYIEDLKKEFGISFSTILPFSSERKIYQEQVWQEIEKILY